VPDSILWRRLHEPGHDACRLESGGSGNAIEGVAAFCEAGRIAQLAYRVECDRAWRTQRGRVTGWMGDRSVDLKVARTPEGSWTLNGAPVPLASELVDLDLAFTPATNLLQLRRIALAPGGSADVPVAWLDAATDGIERLFQRYERRSETTYWYESPSAGYAGLLEVAPSGFVLRYPGLWQAEDVTA
jgi:hypothetical protein